MFVWRWCFLWRTLNALYPLEHVRELEILHLKNTAQKTKFFIKDLFSKWDQIRRNLGIWSNLWKKYLIENLKRRLQWNVVEYLWFRSCQGVITRKKWNGNGVMRLCFCFFSFFFFFSFKIWEPVSKEKTYYIWKYKPGNIVSAPTLNTSFWRRKCFHNDRFSLNGSL